MNELRNDCARELMETVPHIMKAIRMKMRVGHGANISVPQFRTMRFIQRNPESSLTDLAEFLGLTLPSVSKLVDGLVKQELIQRKESTSDRRCLILLLTQTGEKIIDSARLSAQADLVNILEKLSGEELQVVNNAMNILHPIFLHQGNSQSVKDGN